MSIDSRWWIAKKKLAAFCSQVNSCRRKNMRGFIIISYFSVALANFKAKHDPK